MKIKTLFFQSFRKFSEGKREKRKIEGNKYWKNQGKIILIEDLVVGGINMTLIEEYRFET
jgi:hypothetical protein